MICDLKNHEGYIYAYIDWRVVDENGETNKAGHYIYIRHLWIHPKFRKGKTLKALVRLIDQHSNARETTFVYWNNLKHGRRLTPLYSRERLAKQTRKEQPVCTAS